MRCCRRRINWLIGVIFVGLDVMYLCLLLLTGLLELLLTWVLLMLIVTYVMRWRLLVLSMLALVVLSLLILLVLLLWNLIWMILLPTLLRYGVRVVLPLTRLWMVSLRNGIRMSTGWRNLKQNLQFEYQYNSSKRVL